MLRGRLIGSFRFASRCRSTTNPGHANSLTGNPKLITYPEVSTSDFNMPKAKELSAPTFIDKFVGTSNIGPLTSPSTAQTEWEELQEILRDSQKIKEKLTSSEVGPDLDEDIESTAPGYKQRKHEIFKQCQLFNAVQFNDDEEYTWRTQYATLKTQNRKTAWSVHNKGIMSAEAALDMTKVPQQQQLKNLMDFEPVPVCGYIRREIFMSALKYRMFPCTAYMRPKTNGGFVPEPDYLHEALGHLMSLQDEDFANLWQKIGEASCNIVLNSCEEDGQARMDKLENLFWFSMETGMCREDDVVKFYGGAVLSSAGESQHAFSKTSNVEFREWDTEKILNTEVDFTKYANVYYVAHPHDAWKQAMVYFEGHDPELFGLCQPLVQYLAEYDKCTTGSGR